MTNQPSEQTWRPVKTGNRGMMYLPSSHDQLILDATRRLMADARRRDRA